MKVSVVVPSYNARQTLPLCLTTLGHSQLGSGHSFDVTVVDDGSTDGTGQLVARFRSGFDLDYVFIPRTATSGRAAARNAGIERATGDLVVMVDADQIVPPTLLAEHVRYHEMRPDLVVVGPTHELGEGEPDPRSMADGFVLAALPPVAVPDARIQLHAEFSANLNNMATCWDQFWSGNASVRREHLLAVGGFDESFVGWGIEDTELGYRLRQRGLAFAFNSSAIQYHRRKRPPTARSYAEWRRNLARFVRKHHGAPAVAIQPYIDRSGLDWLEGMRRFEYAARALCGRLPRPIDFDVLEVDDANLAEVARHLPERATATDVLVLDDTASGALAGLVQCVDTPHELLYFARPSAAERDRIRTRFGTPR